MRSICREAIEGSTKLSGTILVALSTGCEWGAALSKTKKCLMNAIVLAPEGPKPGMVSDNPSVHLIGLSCQYPFGFNVLPSFYRQGPITLAASSVYGISQSRCRSGYTGLTYSSRAVLLADEADVNLCWRFTNAKYRVIIEV